MSGLGRIAAALLAGSTLSTSPAAAPYRHVLLISIDGMHALDLADRVAAHPDGAPARLAKGGVVWPG